MSGVTREQQRRNDRIAYLIAVVFVTLCIGLSVWMFGRAFDNMTDPCRTEQQRAVTPACR
jgi:hypothetical protein